MKRINIGLSILAVLVLISALVGCAPQEMVTPTGDKIVGGEGGDSYATSGDVTPNGDVAVQFNDMIKPILQDVFGGVKLNMYSTNLGGKGVVLDYMVKKSITQSDLAEVTSRIESKGYIKSLDLIDEDSFLVQEIKENEHIIGIEGSFNEEDIAFSIVPYEG